MLHHTPPSDPVSTSPDDVNSAEDIPISEVILACADSGNDPVDVEVLDDSDVATEDSAVNAGGDAECNTITQRDRDDFTRLDHAVRDTLLCFIHAGRALMEISHRKLWLAGGHSSWAQYCNAVAGLSRIHANRLIRAAEVVDEIAQASQVKPIGFTPVAESQIRPLCRLKKPEQYAEAWSLGVERAGGQPTAKQLRDVVAELMGESNPKAPEPKAPEPKAPEPKAPETKAPEPNDVIAQMIDHIVASVRAGEPYGKIEQQLVALKEALGVRR